MSQGIKQMTEVKLSDDAPIIVNNPSLLRIFTPNEGPKRGPPRSSFSLRHNKDFYKPNAGPKRGIGPMNGMSATTDAYSPYKLNSSLNKIGSNNKIDRNAQKCLMLVNEFRKKNQKPPLTFSQCLAGIAKPHNDAMMSNKIPLGHSGFQQRSAKIPNAMSTAENVGFCYGVDDPVKTLVDGWINSPGHRRNLLGNFNQIGIVIECNRNGYWYGTQFFALI